MLGGAGGVGSIATQLARRLTGLTVIATASRPETLAWAHEMGAHNVIDHRRAIAAQAKAIVPDGVDYVLALTHLTEHFDEIVAVLAPQGALGMIDDPASPLDIAKLKPKSVDAGLIRSTMRVDLGPINAANLQRAHALVESATSIGKAVLSGF